MLVAILIVVLWRVWKMEEGLNERRETIRSADVYWDCERLPPDNVLARVFAGTVLQDQGAPRSPTKWAFYFTSYSLYYRMRLSHDELVDHYLKTPAAREPNCTEIEPPEQAARQSS